jgi:hypothetical protein
MALAGQRQLNTGSGELENGRKTCYSAGQASGLKMLWTTRMDVNIPLNEQGYLVGCFSQSAVPVLYVMIYAPSYKSECQHASSTTLLYAEPLSVGQNVALCHTAAISFAVFNDAQHPFPSLDQVVAFLGFFAPYLLRLVARFATPPRSSAPRTRWYRTPGQSCIRPPRTITTLCC